MVLKYFNVRVGGDRLQERLLYGAPRIVLDMQNSALRMSALSSERRRAVFQARKLYALLYQVLYLPWAGANYRAHCGLVAKAVSGYEGVFYMRIEIVSATCHTCDSALSVVRVSVRSLLFCYYRDLVPELRRLQRETQSGNAASYNYCVEFHSKF